jgi:prophage tail gpP-like protein
MRRCGRFSGNERNGSVGNPMSEFLSSPDEMTLTIGTHTLGPWQSVVVTQSVESMPNSFAFFATDPFSDDGSKVIAKPGDPCTVTCGTQTLITGFVDRYATRVSAREHQIVVTGRGLCQDLVDCSADLASPTSNIRGGMINAASVLDLAQRLCKPFKITARSAIADLGPAIPNYQVALGETPYELIERAARYAGFLVYEDPNGNLVLDRVGTKAMASGFGIPGNVEDASVEYSIDQRFSEYTYVWYSIDQLAELSSIGNQRADVSDPTVPRFRPLIRVSEQIDQTNAFDVAKARANWELARRKGRSQAISLTCDSWRDTAGNLWAPNMLAPIDASVLKLTGQNWIIGTVTFRKDLSGTHADLVLMPPDAFKPEPSVLTLFDGELNRGVPTTQSPDTPGGGSLSGGP